MIEQARTLSWNIFKIMLKENAFSLGVATNALVVGFERGSRRFREKVTHPRQANLFYLF